MSESKEIIFGSIGDIAINHRRSIAEQFTHDVKAILVIDISASMGTHDCSFGHSRYAVAVKELERLQRAIPGKVAIVEFSTVALFAPGGIPSPPQANTDLAAALRFIKPADGCGIDFYIISDGSPDNEHSALYEARQFSSKINTIYIGPECACAASPGYHCGAEFLRDLAAATGGLHATQSVSDIAHLSDTVQRLLTTNL